MVRPREAKSSDQRPTNIGCPTRRGERVPRLQSALSLFDQDHVVYIRVCNTSCEEESRAFIVYKRLCLSACVSSRLTTTLQICICILFAKEASAIGLQMLSTV